MVELVVRAMDTIDRLPRWLQPAANGAGLVWFLILTRAGLIGIPLLIILTILFTEHPWTTLSAIAMAFGLATVGGALAGLAYSLVGRALHRIPLVGRYLAGIATVSPYCAALILIIRLKEHGALTTAVDRAELWTWIVCSLWFGTLLGHFLFESEPEYN